MCRLVSGTAEHRFTAATQANLTWGQLCELQAKRLAGYAPGWQTLMHGLAQPIMDDTSVEQHLKVGARPPAADPCRA